MLRELKAQLIGLTFRQPLLPYSKRRATPHPAMSRFCGRTRVGGDAWLNEVPLGEEIADYEVAILNGGNGVRTLRVTGKPAPTAIDSVVKAATRKLRQ